MDWNTMLVTLVMFLLVSVVYLAIVVLFWRQKDRQYEKKWEIDPENLDPYGPQNHEVMK